MLLLLLMLVCWNNNDLKFAPINSRMSVEKVIFSFSHRVTNLTHSYLPIKIISRRESYMLLSTAKIAQQQKSTQSFNRFFLLKKLHLDDAGTRIHGFMPKVALGKSTHINCTTADYKFPAPPDRLMRINLKHYNFGCCKELFYARFVFFFIPHPPLF